MGFLLHTERQTVGASLVVQWLRICLPMQGTQVRSLVGKLRLYMLWGQLEKACVPQGDPAQTKKKFLIKKMKGQTIDLLGEIKPGKNRLTENNFLRLVLPESGPCPVFFSPSHSFLCLWSLRSSLWFRASLKPMLLHTVCGQPPTLLSKIYWTLDTVLCCPLAGWNRQ